MNWNPMMGPLGASASQSPDLGALVKAFAGPQNSLGQSGVTLGNPEAQDQYRQMAEAFVMQQRAAQDQEAANALQESGWINNSGALGVLDQVVKAYASKKLAKRADEKDIEAREKFYLGEEAAAERKAQREAEREMAQRGQRAADAERYGLQGDARTRYILEGKMGESPRDRLQALEGVNGPGIVNLDQGTVRYAQPEAQREQQLPPNVHIDPNLSPQERAAALAAEGLGLGDPHGDVVDVGRVRPQPTGQFVTAAAAQRAQQNQRQTAQDVRAERADARDQARLESQQAAAQAAAADRAKAGQARQAAAAASAQELIDSIDRVTGSKGYGDLGTMIGDALSHVPFMRTEAKDSQAFLDTVANQVATSTMAQLKALSAQGATGFGALSKPELELLKNNIAALSAGNLSHDALDTSLKVVRDKMEKITSWQDASGQASPAGNGNSRQPPSVSSQAQYDALPSGAIYIEDGKQYRKP